MQQLRLFFAMALLYMFRVTIPPIIRSTYAVYGLIFVVPCATIAFILRNGFTLHVSGDNSTHHQEYIRCIWPYTAYVHLMMGGIVIRNM